MADSRFRAACGTAVMEIAGDRLRVAWTHAGICAVTRESLSANRDLRRRLRMNLIEERPPGAIRKALQRAARGRNDDFPLDLSWARDFEREVLVAAREIPYGQTRSYGWLARAARRPLAVRAAASVMARNPLWLLIPCHRVIYADGRLGPYGSSGATRKLELLAREGVHLKLPRTRGSKRSSERPRTNPR